MVKETSDKPRRVGDGTPGPGRPKGVPNKATIAVKAAIQSVFDGMGGTRAMTKWAKEFPGEFYTKVYPKLLPLDVAVQVDGDLAELLANARKRAGE